MFKDKEDKMKEKRREHMHMDVVYGPPERMRKPFEKPERIRDYPENYEDYDKVDPSMTEVYGPPEWDEDALV